MRVFNQFILCHFTFAHNTGIQDVFLHLMWMHEHKNLDKNWNFLGMKHFFVFIINQKIRKLSFVTPLIN